MRVKLKRATFSGNQRIKLASLMLVIVLVGGLGAYLLGGSHAASPYASANADKGTLTSSAQVIANALASDGNAVQFGTSSGSPTPLPSPGTWTNVTNNLAGMASQCGNLTMLSAVPSSSEVIAGVAGVGLFASSNDGASWTQLGTNSSSVAITNRPTTITYDPTNTGTFWEAGIYGTTYGVYRTTNSGLTITNLGNTYHIEHVAVDFTDPNRLTLLAGGHEESDTLDKSTDGGQTWTNIWSSLPAGIGFTSDPVIINSQTYLINSWPSWGGGTPGIYRTTNGGTSWTQVSTQGPDGAALITPTGTIYWADGSSLVTSSNNGVSWTQVGSNLLDITPIQLPDGRLVSIDTSNHLVVSANGGSTWTEFGAALPFTPPTSDDADLAYSSGEKAFFISQWDCGNVVLPNAIEKLQ